MQYRLLLILIMGAGGLTAASAAHGRSPGAAAGSKGSKPRVILSTDIGGTDPDDFQSLIHYLMYADRFETEGLISSPYGPGRKEDILRILDLYEKDYRKLAARAPGFPPAGELRKVVKQGALETAPERGWSSPTEGSEWIIRQAGGEDARPLWVLVWGGLEDLAQALHDAPGIAPRIRVYWIGGPNKKWSLNAYRYIVQNFPALHMIEANSTYRGWFLEDASQETPDQDAFFETHIRGAGFFGRDFENYYGGAIKMGDSPSVAYLLHGNPEKPGEPGWGGKFVPLRHSARRIFTRNTSLADTIAVYGMIEWIFRGPEADLEAGAPCLRLAIDGQFFDGYYQGAGQYTVRFAPKAAGNWEYRLTGTVPGWKIMEGQFVSADPWPGAAHKDDIGPLTGWWSDDPAAGLFLAGWQGAGTVGRWRADWMTDWAKRWAWLKEK